jgi:hypothetical protein
MREAEGKVTVASSLLGYNCNYHFAQQIKRRKMRWKES